MKLARSSLPEATSAASAKVSMPPRNVLPMLNPFAVPSGRGICEVELLDPSILEVGLDHVLT